MAKAKKIKPGDKVPDEVVELMLKADRYAKAGRANYKKVDAVVSQLVELCEPGVEVIIPAEMTSRNRVTPERKIKLVDQFETANAVWAGSLCRRYVVDVDENKPRDRSRK